MGNKLGCCIHKESDILLLEDAAALKDKRKNSKRVKRGSQNGKGSELDVGISSEGPQARMNTGLSEDKDGLERSLVKRLNATKKVGSPVEGTDGYSAASHPDGTGKHSPTEPEPEEQITSLGDIQNNNHLIDQELNGIQGPKPSEFPT